MRYYLSYVEIYYRGAGPFPHPTLMLSTQSNESEPAKVVVETGFGYHRIDDSNHFYPRLRPGSILEEKIAERAVAGKHALYHRTYELSSVEAEHFIKIIDRDKQRSDENMKYFYSKSTPMVSEFKYHIITHNCKVYALGVLKELGIVEASELSNFFIQIPGTHHSLFKRLSDKELQCSSGKKSKELVGKITSALTQFNENIKSVIPDHKKIPRLSNQLIGLTEESILDPKLFYLSFDLRIKDILRHLNDIDTEKKDNLKQTLEDILKDAQALDELYHKERRPSFIWKKPPPLAKRQVLTNFTPEEKVLYIIKTKTREISDRLQNIVSYLNQRIDSNHLGNPHLSQDLIALKEITEEFKNRLDKKEQLFLNSIAELTSEQLIRQCVNQGERLNDFLETFDQAIANFTPKTQESSVVIRWIKVILSYIKSDFFTIENAQSLIKAESSSAKKENKHLDSKIKISKPGFFKSYCDIDSLASTSHACTRTLN